MTRPLTRSSIFAQSWPIMLGQASIPLVGIVDTAVIGRTGEAVALAGVALGATIIALVFWTFGFLRMGMTGLTAQAAGSDDRGEVEALLLRALCIGFGLGLILLALNWPIRETALGVMSATERVNTAASGSMQGRFLGAPAALCVYAINGWLLGLGRTREALALQIAMNVCNIALDVWLVWRLDMGAFGVGLGTALAEWSAMVLGTVLAGRVAGAHILALARRTSRAALLASKRLKRLFAVNRDIMIRTVALLILFTWFTNSGARLGATSLAANHVLMQFVAFAAFVLDAFAFTAEERVGSAIGRASRTEFVRAVRLAGEFSLLSAALFAFAFHIWGGAVVDLLTTDPAIREEVRRFLPFAALIPLVGLPSWLLDGVFIGATRGSALRNAGIAATVLYIATDLALRGYGNGGVWIAMCIGYIYRAGGLAIAFPRLLRSIEASPHPQDRAID